LTVAVVPRTTTREIRRYKARATRSLALLLDYARSIGIRDAEAQIAAATAHPAGSRRRPGSFR
jgi:hypothetical protein